jgi:arginine N-succinyltransferase
MFAIRPVRENDLPVLVQLAGSIGGGLTTLPANEDVLGDRIADSLRAFSPRVKRPRGEYYLFVLEDTGTGEIVGTSGIVSRVGGFEPWYGYEIRAEKFVHQPLRIEKDIATLHLKMDHRGPSEACSLFLRSDRRGGGNGRLLSLARFLFIAAFRARFTDTVVAELRGYMDDSGHSPFWDAVGQIFFESDFYRADLLSGLGDKDFIAALMPKHPIYVPLLPKDVQAVIGRVHRDAEPALALLRAEGFADTNEVDIFDAGPLVQAQTDSLRTVRESKTAVILDLLAEAPATSTHLISNAALDFRACLGAVSEHADGISLPRVCAHALGVKAGDQISYSPLK